MGDWLHNEMIYSQQLTGAVGTRWRVLNTKVLFINVFNCGECYSVDLFIQALTMNLLSDFCVPDSFKSQHFKFVS